MMATWRSKKISSVLVHYYYSGRRDTTNNDVPVVLLSYLEQW